MGTKQKRFRFEVVPATGAGWNITLDRVVIEYRRLKVEAVREAASRGRDLEDAGMLAQLHIKRADGTYQDERTYGKDPRGRG